MSNMLKCPNPSCPYVFDPSQVPVGVVLSCPRCAMQFTLGPPAPVAPPSTTAALPPNRPPAPSSPTESDFEAVGRTATQERQARTERADRTAARPAREPSAPRVAETFGLKNWHIYLVAALSAVVAVLFVMLGPRLFRRDRDTGPTDALSRWPDLNAGVDTPPSDWTRDDSMRVKLGSPYVISYKRENPEAYMAFGANAFGSDHTKGRTPRPSEMSTDLKRAFPKFFDMSSFRDEAAPESKWLGETIAPSLGFKFRAQSSDGLAWAGEAYAVSHKGMAYYWLSWCQENDFDGLKGQFADFRNKFRILELRKNWKDAGGNIVDYKGDKVPYTLSDSEEVWREISIADEKMADPDLDKLLRVRLTPKGDRHAIPEEAELRVYVLDGGGEPLAVARKFAEDKETARINELNPDFAPPTFEELTDGEQGDPITGTAPKTAQVVRLRSKVKESMNAGRLIVASGLKVGDKTVVVRCWCESARRNMFETKLVQIASSLR
jgi:hypothetical protein